MKHLKYFESNKDYPRIGDYVICEESSKWASPEDLKNFISNNIGIVKEHDTKTNHEKIIFVIQYNNIPDNVADYFNYNYYDCRGYYIENIKHFSSDKKNLEIFINANKFNL